MNTILLAEADEISMEIEVLHHFNVFGIDFAFTNSLWYALWISAFLILFAFIVNRKLKHVDPMKPPKGLQNALEMVISTLENFTVETMGPAGKKFAAFYGCLFLYIMCCNLSGLFFQGSEWLFCCVPRPERYQHLRQQSGRGHDQRHRLSCWLFVCLPTRRDAYACIVRHFRG